MIYSQDHSLLVRRDLRHNWHPCTQMKDHEIVPLFEVAAANGCYIELTDGRKIIDAISSWWCKSLGHQHPRIKRAVMTQLEKFEHVIFAGTTYDVVASLSEQLAGLMPELDKVLYAGDGSCAVEMALKLSVHAHRIDGQPERTKFLALRDGYHGETTGAMSVSDLGLYRDPYQSMLFPVEFISVPYVSGENDPLWHDCEEFWHSIIPVLEKSARNLSAIIVEPVVQGAGGMKVYSADFLSRLRAWTKQYGIHLIADEIMTGLGRTGKMLASSHAKIVPDFLCLSKGLTSGWLPLSVTLTSQSIYDLFYDDYDSGNSFLHSHTYAGNALAASAALETLAVIKDENIITKVVHLGGQMLTAMRDIAADTGFLKNIRGLGAVVAADINTAVHTIRSGLDVYLAAMRAGALLRPLGNTIYWLPPLVMSDGELAGLVLATRSALQGALQKKQHV